MKILWEKQKMLVNSIFSLSENVFCPVRQKSSLPFSLDLINSLPDIPILGSANSAADKDMLSKIGQIEIQLSD